MRLKLTITLLTVCCLQLFAAGQRITLNERNTSLSHILNKIEKQSGYTFFYNKKEVKEETIDVEVDNESLPKTLDVLFQGKPYGYEIHDKIIVLNRRPVVPTTVSSDNTKDDNSTLQQTITGIVRDTEGNPLQGVSVVVQETGVGTTTDEDGRYEVAALIGQHLAYSNISYQSVVREVSSGSSINVVLEEMISDLDEVVVVGYGTQRRGDITGSVASVVVDEKLSSRTLTNVSSALSGLIPGLNVQQSTGQAGRNTANLMIRGLGTVNNAGPLIVVDGMPDVDINRIDMNDIASISVLKDAASASVYGSRAANGVILITTKTGAESSRTTINYTGNVALSQPTNFYEFFDDYPRSLAMHRWAAEAGQEIPSFNWGTIEEWMAKGLVDPVLYPNTDWWDVLLNTGRIQNHNVSASGGTDKMNFYMSAGMMDEKGILVNHDFKRYNTRLNLDYNINDKIKVGTRIDGQWTNQVAGQSEGMIIHDNASAGFDIQSVVAGILPRHPETGLYGGAMAYGEDPFAMNMLARLDINNRLTDRQEFNGTLYGEWQPLEGLTVRGDYSLRYYNQFHKVYADATDNWNFQTNQIVRNMEQSNPINDYLSSGYKTLLQGRITYEKELFPDHQFTAMAAYNEEFWFARSMSAGRNDRIHPSLTEINTGLTNIQRTGGSSEAEGLRSVIGRLNYKINDKYLFELNARYDGSSKFLPGYQYGFFPSVSAGWRFTEEDFLSGLKSVISDGKIRASIGGLGNNSGVGRYEQRDIFSLTNYILDGSIAQGFSSARLVNPDFSWEQTNVTNIGLDLVFFNGQLQTEIDLYERMTEGMIRPSELSSLLSGYSAPRMNIGRMRNRGIEANITWQTQMGEVQWGANLNLSYNVNRLLEWNQLLGKGQVFLDMPYQYVYTRVSTGIAQGWQDIANAPFHGQFFAPGDILYEDRNGDGQISGEDNIAFPYMRNQPFVNYGFNLFGSWKGFDVSALLQGITGRRDFWLEPFNNINIPTSRKGFQTFHWDDTWNLYNRDAGMPRVLTGSGGSNRTESTFWLDNMSYLRLKNVQVGYNIPTSVTSYLGIGRVRAYFTAENLFTISSFRGIDPEKSSAANDPFPLLKSYSFGLNISL